MSGINLSASIRTNLLQLQATNRLFDRTSARLASGLRVNSALDGANAFFTARSLTNRANDLTNLKDGLGLSIETVKSADKSINSLIKLVEQAESLATQAKEAATGGVSKITGDALGVSGLGAATTFSLVFTALVDDDEIIITLTSGATATYTFVTGSSVQDFIDFITNHDTALTASYDANTFQIIINADAGTDITFTDTTGTTTAEIFGAAVTSGTEVVFGTQGSGATTGQLQTDFNKVMVQITQLVSDATFKGVNLLNGQDLTVTINEGGTTLTVGSTTLSLSNLGFDTDTVNFAAVGVIDLAIIDVKEALQKLREVAGGFGTDLTILQTRDSFTSDLVNSLEAGSGLLINANLEEEAANLLALQTRQALGTTALAFSNQSQQSILQLFR